RIVIRPSMLPPGRKQALPVLPAPAMIVSFTRPEREPRGHDNTPRGAPRVTTDPTFFRDLSYVLIAAVAGGFVARLLRQPLIVGFVLAGILIGPFTPGPQVSDLHTFELFAEI